MFTTSMDLLYGAIAFSVLVFTGFLVWILFYVAQILKQGNEVIREIREKITEFEEVLTNIKEKVMTSASSISFIAKEIGTVVDLVRTRKKEKDTTRKKE